MKKCHTRYPNSRRLQARSAPDQTPHLLSVPMHRFDLKVCVSKIDGKIHVYKNCLWRKKVLCATSGSEQTYTLLEIFIFLDAHKGFKH